MRNECDPISGVTFDRPSSFSCFHKAEVFLIPCQKQARGLNRPTKPLQPKVHLVAQPVGRAVWLHRISKNDMKLPTKYLNGFTYLIALPFFTCRSLFSALPLFRLF